MRDVAVSTPDILHIAEYGGIDIEKFLEFINNQIELTGLSQFHHHLEQRLETFYLRWHITVENCRDKSGELFTQGGLVFTADKKIYRRILSLRSPQCK